MELGDISDGMQIGAGVLQFIGSLRKVVGADVISAFFKYDGTRIEGSEKIEVQLLPDKHNPKQIWWYTVKATDDYVFLRIPVIQSCAHEITGRLNNELQNDARYWRWVPPVLPGRIYGGEDPLNLKVDFLIFGYRPKALLSHFGK